MDSPEALPLHRQWWAVAVCVLLGLAGAGALISMRPSRYESAVSILVEAVPVQSPAGQMVNSEINLDTEAELARSSATATAAAKALHTDSTRLIEGVRVEVLANTSVLVLHFAASTPAAAQAGARAFAEAYLANRAQLASAALAGQSAALTKMLKQSVAKMDALNARIARLPSDSPQLDALRTNRLTLNTQVNTLTARLTDLSTTTVDPGRIIRDADLPTAPVRQSVPLTLVAGAAVGLAAGLLASAARDRLSRRVRAGIDVTRHTGLPVLAEFAGDLPGLRTLAPKVFAPQHPPGRAFHRLRNEVVAALGDTEQVILVTGASPGRASTVVAANLAAALARADNEVILVGANVPELGTDGLLLSHVFDIADVPGLTDVLTGRAALTSALQRAPRAPRLRVITPGGTASAAGLLQSEAVRATIGALREHARYVVVEAPSAASGADAQSLANLADAAILVAEAGRARHAQVADAAVQLKVVGTRVLGAVVLPPLAGSSEEDDEPAEPGHRAENAALRATDTWINPGTMNLPTAVHPVVPAPAPDATSGPRFGAPKA